MGDRGCSSRITPGAIALCYLGVGCLWILFSDRAVAAFAADSALETHLQTVKGWFFVAASAALVYGLTTYGRRELAETNARLDAAIQQTSVLNRVLRHNLRNTSNVVHASAESLRQDADEVGEDQLNLLEIIVEETNELVELSEKSTQLRQLVLEDDESAPPVELDLVALVETRLERARDDHPDVRFVADLPETARVEAHPSFGLAIDELLENAVEHNRTDDLGVRVSIRTAIALESRVEGYTILEIADDGTGVPGTERDVLETDVEGPLVHSRGLGLWLARTVVDQSGGEFRIVDNEPQGTIVRITLPS